jgi:hypothetical protein
MSRSIEISPPVARRSWLAEFEWSDGRIQVRKTGVRLNFDRDLIAEVWAWVQYFAVLAVVAPRARIARRRPLSVWFAPDIPRAWYLIRGACLWAGIAVARNAEEADAIFYFDDVTRGDAPAPDATGKPRFNFACNDVSKSRVASVFEEVFGYALSVDPRTFDGPMVEKSEKNGVHDGCLVERPLTPKPDHVYQRLVDTTDDSGLARDLRTLIAGGAPVLVWTKVKPAGRRFSINNRHAFLQAPQEVYSPAELALIRAFARRIGLDWGGLDILRDRNDGRLYIVDVNKTDVGPVIALSWRDKIRSMGLLAGALERMVAGACAQEPARGQGVQPGQDETAHAI